MPEAEDVSSTRPSAQPTAARSLWSAALKHPRRRAARRSTSVERPLGLPADGVLRRPAGRWCRAMRRRARRLARPPARHARAMGDHARADRLHGRHADLPATLARDLRNRGGGSRALPSHRPVARRTARRRLHRGLSVRRRRRVISSGRRTVRASMPGSPSSSPASSPRSAPPDEWRSSAGHLSIRSPLPSAPSKRSPATFSRAPPASSARRPRRPNGRPG